MSDISAVNAELDFIITRGDTFDSLKLLVAKSLADLVLEVYHARPVEIADFLAKERKKRPKLSTHQGFIGYHLQDGWTNQTAAQLPVHEQPSDTVYGTQCEEFENNAIQSDNVADLPHLFSWTRRENAETKIKYVRGLLNKMIVDFDGSIALCKAVMSPENSFQELDCGSRANAEKAGLKYGNILHRWQALLSQQYQRESTVTVKIGKDIMAIPQLTFLNPDTTYNIDPAELV